jgi:excinuclease UvrABC nuclease subunit
VPERFYSNADTLKEAILNENKSKSGVYRFTNLTNGKSYIGSSINLRKRLNHYYSGSRLLRTKTTSAISNALLKYGLFKLYSGNIRIL